MKKETIRSLTAKGWSQRKIAKTLKIRKMKVVTYQKTHKIGKRIASSFWKDVERERVIGEKSFKDALKKIKYQPYWFKKRQARLKGKEKARDEMREKWQRIVEGQVQERFWEEAEGEDLMEAAEY